MKSTINVLYQNTRKVIPQSKSKSAYLSGHCLGGYGLQRLPVVGLPGEKHHARGNECRPAGRLADGCRVGTLEDLTFWVQGHVLL